MISKDFSDPMVAKAGMLIKTSRKWRAEEAMLQAESWLHHSDLVGVKTRGKSGLGSQ